MSTRYDQDATAMQQAVFPAEPPPFTPDGHEPRPRSNLPYFAGGAVLGIIALIGLFAFTRSSDGGQVDATDDPTSLTTSSVPETTLTTGGEELDTTSVPTTSIVTTTAPTTAAPTTAVPTTSAPQVVPVRWPDDYGWEPSDEPYFSGCTPGTADGLPDGVWFGYVKAVSSAGIDFDLACHFGVGLDEFELDEELITNDSTKIRSLPWSAAASIFTFSNETGPVGPMSVDEHVSAGRLDGTDEAIVTIAGSTIVEVRYRPMAG